MARDESASVKLGSIGAEGAKALQVETLDGRTVWLPWSHIYEVHRDDDPPRVVVAAWLAEKEDL